MLEAAGLRGDDRPADEVVLFSAKPSFRATAYAVRIVRSDGASATLDLVELAQQQRCNRYDRVGEWRVALSWADTDRLFAEVELLERNWHLDDEIVVDGTSLKFIHYRRGRMTTLPLSSSAEGQSGRLSALILSLARQVPGTELPTTPDWVVR